MARRSRTARKACRTSTLSCAALGALQRVSTPSTRSRLATTICGPGRSRSAARCYGSNSGGAAPALLYSEHMDGQDSEARFRHPCVIRLEGIVSKRVDSRYKSGRCLSWGKVKNP